MPMVLLLQESALVLQGIVHATLLLAIDYGRGGFPNLRDCITFHALLPVFPCPSSHYTSLGGWQLLSKLTTAFPCVTHISVQPCHLTEPCHRLYKAAQAASERLHWIDVLHCQTTFSMQSSEPLASGAGPQLDTGAATWRTAGHGCPCCLATGSLHGNTM